VNLSTVGFVTANNQYREIFKAITRLPRDLRRRVKFVIGGEIRPYEYDIKTVIEQNEVEENVVVTGFLTETEMETLLFASDLVFNLRYPTYGESSGSVARALGLGCALAVTDAGSYAELPSEVAFKIPAKVDPTDPIAGLIREVIDAPDRLVSRKEAALAYARAHLDPAKLAARYAEILLQEATAR
jgi:glycosyltransferase involved in cell wall biosynthesis